MSGLRVWEVRWEGRATDFVPDLLSTLGHPGVLAVTARDLLWEAVQRVGERDSTAWVRAAATGGEDKENPGLGELTVKVVICSEPSAIEQKIQGQAPVDLLRTPGDDSPSPEPVPLASSRGVED